MKKPRVRITDHALVRFLERVGGVDVDGLRQALSRSLEEAARLGAAAVVIDGYRYVLRVDEDGPILVTVEPFTQASPIHRTPHPRVRPPRGGDEA
ncbi:MAG: hypothetical protein MUE83_00935 [Tabrizicola sp.]|nr:hypothetical protein [Tabrizicola sp.]